MEITVNHLGAVQFEIKARQHTLISDQPPENGGFDEGVTPPELLLAALGSCAAYYAAEYLRSRNLATEGTRVGVTADKAKNPPRLDNFQIKIQVPVSLSAEHEAGVQRAVHQCLIHNTLLNPPKIETTIASPALATA